MRGLLQACSKSQNPNLKKKIQDIIMCISVIRMCLAIRIMLYYYLYVIIIIITISLMSHVTKLVLRILMNRLRARSLMEISQVQYGLMPDRGTRNAIFVLRRLVERSIQKQAERCIHMIH